MRRECSRLMMIGVLLVCGACSSSHSPTPAKLYATEYGLGPDKWATAWLLAGRTDANATLKVLEPNASPGEAVLFDMPEASIRRIRDRSAFEVALSSLEISDPVLVHMARIVHHIEVNFWQAEGPPEADIVEVAYRGLQQRYGRDRVSADCYLAFFDRVHSVLVDSQQSGRSFDLDRISLSCEELVQIAHHADALVPEVPIADVISANFRG